MWGRISSLDRTVFLAINHGLVHFHLDGPMALLTRIGSAGAVWLALFFLIFVFGGRSGRRLALTGVFALALAAFVSDEILKGLVERPRPFDPTQLGTLARVVGPRPSGFAFPSGHAATSFASAAILRRLGMGWAWFAWLLAGLIALSRVYVGAHFPLDVLAGILVGLFAAWLAVRLLGDPSRTKRGRLGRRPRA